MPQLTSVENSFIGGLKTEFTGLNFPENACTDTQNCVFSLIGDVFRRPGIDFEINQATLPLNTNTNLAFSEYKWNNAGGNGSIQVVVQQVGGTLFFYQSSSATISTPLSTTRLASTVALSQFTTPGSSVPDPIECTYADGNGYLFVFHPNLDPFYCTYSSGVITPSTIGVQIRDFTGIIDGLADNTRPTSGQETNQHLYNLQNQGWASQAPWSATSSSSVTINVGVLSFNVQAGLPITLGTSVNITALVYSGPTPGGPGAGGGTGGIPTAVTLAGVVNFYSGSTISVNVTSVSPSFYTGQVSNSWTISPSVGTGQINTWVAAIGNYPSNADVWWTFKDDTNIFNPAVTIGNVTLSLGPAPKGSYILSAFNQDRSAVSGVQGISPVSTTVRPKTGTWFQGRVWYSGVDAAFPTGNSPTSWSEAIYFSQIIQNPTQFGRCYQTNDPTSETLSTLLPTDGGIISIPGCGSIYKLFPIQQGIVVFAANGVWFVTGGTSIGFSADDYTVVKISGVKSISRHSYVDVNGLPFFWNEEGIYAVEPAQAGSGNRTNEQLGLQVNPLTLGTILSFYNNIPLQSKKYVRAAYNPITYVIKWLYRSTNETGVTSRYQFDSVLNYNTANKAFYPYSLSVSIPYVAGILYLEGPGGSSSPAPTFKFTTIINPTTSVSLTFSEENSLTYLDWFTYDGVGVNYNSYFVTGYKIPGEAQRKFETTYVYMFTAPKSSYKIQGLWDYSTSGNTGRWSSVQITLANLINHRYMWRRHKIRGHGISLQLKVQSIQGQPFDIIGWSIPYNVNAGP